MAIPLEGLYTQKAPGLGRIPRYDPITYIRTFAAGDAGIKFGSGLFRDGTDPILARVPSSSNKTYFIGVAVNAPDTHESDYTTKAYTSGSAVGVCDHGPIMVYVEEAVTPSSAVRLRHTVSAGDATCVPGDFLVTADAGKTVLLSGGIEFRGTASSGNQVELYINGPVTVTADT
jgi:hypothetical protein